MQRRSWMLFHNAQMPGRARRDTRIELAQLLVVDGILLVFSAIDDYRLHFDGVTFQVADDFCALTGNALQVVQVAIEKVG